MNLRNVHLKTINWKHQTKYGVNIDVFRVFDFMLNNIQ